MPYPVPPPAPPPLVTVVSPEAIAQSSSAVIVSGQPSASVNRAAVSPTITASASAPVAVCSLEQSPSSCGTDANSAIERAATRAAVLGSPLEVTQTTLPFGAPPPATYGVSTGASTLEADLVKASIAPPGQIFEPLASQRRDLRPSVGVWQPVANRVVNRDRQQIEQESRQLHADLQRLRLPILEELAQAPATGAPSTLIDPDDPNDQILIIPGAGSPVIPPSPSTPQGTPTTPGLSIPGQPLDASGTGEVVELTADEQEYDNIQQVFFAQGNVVMRFRGAILTSDRLRVNLPNRIAVAEGNVVLNRGDQVLRGDRFVYNFVQQQGDVTGARGEILLSTIDRDFAPALPTDISAGTLSDRPITERIPSGQPAQGVSSPGGISIVVGGGGNRDLDTQAASGDVRRLRFEADQIDFTATGWEATNVRITNDPFSPPELELRSNRVTFTRLSTTRSEIRARNPRLVFDQGLSIPLLRDRVILDSRRRDPGLVQFGFDQDDRGGLYIQRAFEPIATPAVRFTITPQILIQRAFDDGGNFSNLRNYGLIARLDANLSPTTAIRATTVFTSLDADDFEEEFRASLRLRQQLWRHEFSVDYGYRDRLFNGSLGFQTVQSSIGLVVTSPQYTLGNSGIGLSYQGSLQYINADTDQIDLLEPIRENNRVGLTRYQASAALSRGFLLWAGTALPATAEEGLRYSPYPLTPYIALYTGVRGVFSGYSNGDTQPVLTGTVSIQGQFGHYSRDFLDYTAVLLSYSLTAQGGESPFLFDRYVDRQVLSFGIIQQLYGPLRIGFQSSINLDRDSEIDTDYILEYSRRTYAISLRYNPVREVGSLGLRISDFNWGSTPEPFSGSSETGSVDGGVQRSRN
ncbi:MAG: DUF3769 domain-containing protein [Oculatellaceae cyanobacterium bins.114]|nr:DUF3769 domain-containing protein [Oculatellaceae cyanobacterium bins.114]